MFILPGPFGLALKPAIAESTVKKYIANGRVYEETGSRKFLIKGRIVQTGS